MLKVININYWTVAKNWRGLRRQALWLIPATLFLSARNLSASIVAADTITWTDGSISTSANTVGYGATINMTSVTWNNSSYSTTETLFSECVAGSSITMTTQGGHVRLTLQGNGQMPTSLQDMNVSYLEDGAFAAPLTNAGGLLSVFPNNGISGQPIWFVWNEPQAPAGGPHTWCVTLRTGGAGVSMIFPNGEPAQFRVEEIR